MKLRHAAAHEIDPGDAGNAQKTRVNVVARRFPEFGRAARRARETDADDRKSRKSQPMNLQLCGRRQRRANFGQAAEHVQLGLRHVGRPVEEHVYFGRAARRGRANIDRAGDVLHRFFDGTRDVGHHFVGRHHAVVDEDHHAREVRLRKYRRGHRQRQ